MKRRNVQQAFVGEPNPNQEGLAVQDEGEDAVDIEVRSGRVLVTVPASTPDDRVLEHPGYLSGELMLEDGRTLTFEIQDGAVGAQWNVLEHQGREAIGLSTIDPPGGV